MAKRNACPGGSPRPACDYSKRERGDGHGRVLGMSKPKLPSEGFGLDDGKVFSGLRKHFRFPPFSVLRAMDGEWMNRKRMWMRLGIKSEVGRGGEERESARSRIKTSCDDSRKPRK